MNDDFAIKIDCALRFEDELEFNFSVCEFVDINAIPSDLSDEIKDQKIEEIKSLLEEGKRYFLDNLDNLDKMKKRYIECRENEERFKETKHYGIIKYFRFNGEDFGVDYFHQNNFWFQSFAPIIMKHLMKIEPRNES